MVVVGGGGGGGDGGGSGSGRGRQVCVIDGVQGRNDMRRRLEWHDKRGNKR